MPLGECSLSENSRECHAEFGRTKDQEPYRWKSVAEATKKALTARYQLLPYWETLFAQASKDGTWVRLVEWMGADTDINRPPVRPLVFEFPEPQYAGVEEQFLVGPNLYITPVLKEGGKSVKGIFPKDGGAWRDWFTHKVSLIC
jgi:alpha-glucosidase